MNEERFRHNYKKQHGSIKNATKAWIRRLEAKSRAKRRTERLKAKGKSNA